MKKYEFNKWSSSAKESGLLFFAQSMEEMLFHYGHDSYKVPSLNFHYICKEYLETIKNVEEGVLYIQNLKPIYSEFFKLYETDHIAKELYPDGIELFFFKKAEKGGYNQSRAVTENDFDNKDSKDINEKIEYLKKILTFLINDMEKNSKYFNLIKENINKLIENDEKQSKKWERLYSLTRILLSELTSTYSQEYIYATVREIFYSNKNVDNSKQILENFWERFNFEKKDYTVHVQLDEEDIEYLKVVEEITIENVKIEETELKAATMKIESFDPHSARKIMVSKINNYIFLIQYVDHEKRSFKNKDVYVRYNDEEPTKIEEPITFIKRRRIDSPKVELKEKIKNSTHILNFDEKMKEIYGFHSIAVNSDEITNQFINLWTIVEVLVEPELEKSKINQICNVLTSVLNVNYLYSLLEQMYFDLIKCIPNFENDYLTPITKNMDNIEKLSYLIIFENEKFEEINKTLQDHYPVLSYRLNKYKILFVDRNKIKETLKNHNVRLDWQIKRVYRNRNLLMHNGQVLFYFEKITQNLHFYVDSLIDILNEYAVCNYSDIKSSFVDIQYKELKHIQVLEKKTDDENKLPLPVEEENFLNVVLGFPKIRY